MELRKPDAVLSEAVEIRCMDFASVTADVRITHVIHENDHDVRSRRGGLRERKPTNDKQNRKCGAGNKSGSERMDHAAQLKTNSKQPSIELPVENS